MGQIGASGAREYSLETALFAGVDDMDAVFSPGFGSGRGVVRMMDKAAGTLLSCQFPWIFRLGPMCEINGFWAFKSAWAEASVGKYGNQIQTVIELSGQLIELSIWLWAKKPKLDCLNWNVH